MASSKARDRTQQVFVDFEFVCVVSVGPSSEVLHADTVETHTKNSCAAARGDGGGRGALVRVFDDLDSLCSEKARPSASQGKIKASVQAAYRFISLECVHKAPGRVECFRKNSVPKCDCAG